MNRDHWPKRARPRPKAVDAFLAPGVQVGGARGAGLQVVAITERFSTMSSARRLATSKRGVGRIRRGERSPSRLDDPREVGLSCEIDRDP